MNLMRLFNKDYFKENVRKSKGLLAFFLGVIPLINILILIINILNIDNVTLFDFRSISVVTFLGMYVIPVLLALTLLGFVFKRKSVDFVLSKPITRKTIYTTNIIGGIGIIILFMLINSLIFGGFNLFSSKLVIPLPLIIDYFLYFVIAYIFVFMVTVLGISLAGNFMGTVVAIMIVICLFPFFKLIGLYYNNNYEYNNYIKCDDKECMPAEFNCDRYGVTLSDCNKKVAKNQYPLSYERELDDNFVAPLTFFSNNGELSYNGSSIIKMLLLSLVYAVVGFYLFINRKMENNETSFKNEKLHYIIKSITLIPITFITYLIIKDEPLIGMLVSVAMILIYSALYDLVTKREIYKFGKSSVISLVVFGILLGAYTLGVNISKLGEAQVLDINDIEYIKYGYIDGTKITDKSVIKALVKTTLEDKENMGRQSMQMRANGKNYIVYLGVNSDMQNLIDTFTDMEMQNKYKNFDIDNIVYARDIELTKTLKKLVKEAYQKMDLTNIDEEKMDEVIQVAVYKDHEYQYIKIPKLINKDLDKYVLDYQNTKALEMIEENDSIYYDIYMNDIEFSDLDSYVFSYVVEENVEALKDYLENDNTEFTNTTAMLSLTGKKFMHIKIGDAKKFMTEFKKWQEKVKNEEEYQDLVNQYNRYYSKDTEAIDEY